MPTLFCQLDLNFTTLFINTKFEDVLRCLFERTNISSKKERKKEKIAIIAGNRLSGVGEGGTHKLVEHMSVSGGGPKVVYSYVHLHNFRFFQWRLGS